MIARINILHNKKTTSSKETNIRAQKIIELKFDKGKADLRRDTTAIIKKESKEGDRAKV